MTIEQTAARIAALKAELDSLRPLNKEQEARIMQKFRLDWNYHSNNIEGNSLSYGETKALIMYGITAQGKPLKDHLEVTGHDEALKWLEELIREERPLTEHFIRQLHELILKEPYHKPAITPGGQPTQRIIRIGQYKTSPNHVVTRTGETFHFASPEETPALMNDLMDWYNTEAAKPDPNVWILAAGFHYKFIRIHPFDDGNGRLARILMNFILMKHGFPPVIIKTEKKADYYSALQQADADNLEAFFIYIGEHLIHSLDIIVKGAKGESIEEPDDLDKKIALLKARLDPKKEVTKKFSSEIQNEIVSFFEEYLIKPLREKLEKFKDLFDTVSLDHPGGKEMSLSAYVALYDYRNLEIQLICSKFKRAGIENIFDCYTSIKIVFRDYNYLIRFNDREFSKLYTELFSVEECKTIAKLAAEDILVQIESYISKIQ